MDNAKVLEMHIIEENGIGYTLGEDGVYYLDLKLTEGNSVNKGRAVKYFFYLLLTL